MSVLLPGNITQVKSFKKEKAPQLTWLFYAALASLVQGFGRVACQGIFCKNNKQVRK